MDDHIPIEPEEILYRRVVASQPWCDVPGKLTLPKAFKPVPADVDGISLYRARFVSPEELARQGRAQAGYFVVGVKVADLRSLGLRILSSPAENLPGHVVLPDVTYDLRDTREVRDILEFLVSFVCEFHGPFKQEAS